MTLVNLQLLAGIASVRRVQELLDVRMLLLWSEMNGIVKKSFPPRLSPSSLAKGLGLKRSGADRKPLVNEDGLSTADVNMARESDDESLG